MDWLTWQLADSAFPTGGFAHSWGLEAAWLSGEIATPAALDGFIRDTLWQTGRALLPFVNAAHCDPNRLAHLDGFCDAFLANAVANRASRIQGRSLVATCSRVWPGRPLADLETQVRGLCGHLGPASGAAYRLLDVSLPVAQRLTLFSALRGVSAAAVRLGIIGSYQAQSLQHGCAAELDAVLRSCAGLGEADVAHTAPLLDLLQSAHDRLYSHLFQS